METSMTAQREVAVGNERSASAPQETTSRQKESYWSKLVPRSLVQVLLIALAALVIAVHLDYLVGVSTTVPHLDDWNLLEKMFRALDIHRVQAWMFDSTNGHFLVPAALGYLISWRYLGLDLAPLRLLNFPICLAAFLSIAHVINSWVRGRFLRFYLYAGTSFIVFSLCFWEHFTLASGFAALLSVLFGGIGLYHLAKATQSSAEWVRGNLLIGFVLILCSVLSLGAGYAAAAAAVCLLGLCALKGLVASRRIPGYRPVLQYAWAFGLLILFSHPWFRLTSRLVRAVFHSILVMGSSGSIFLDRNTALAQNVAFVVGSVLLIASLWIGLHFLQGRKSPDRLFPTFAFALVLFGVLGCLAVAVGRAYLPTPEFLNSRYTLYPSVCLLGILLYFAAARLFLLPHVWCLAAGAYLLATVTEEQVGFYRPGLYRQMAAVITESDSYSDDQLRSELRWRENTKGVRKVVARMRKDQLNVFGALHK
jgi:hypothetical protein